MVWARTKLVIEDDIISPSPFITISFKGREPEKFYKEIPELVATVFRVHRESIQEKKFSMHKGEPDKFKADWEIIKDLDKFSYYRILITFNGESFKGHGTAKMVVESSLRTEYPQDTHWQRSLFYEIMRMVWHTMFYTSKRERYMIEGRRLTGMLVDDIKALTRV